MADTQTSDDIMAEMNKLLGVVTPAQAAPVPPPTVPDVVTPAQAAPVPPPTVPDVAHASRPGPRLNRRSSAEVRAAKASSVVAEAQKTPVVDELPEPTPAEPEIAEPEIAVPASVPSTAPSAKISVLFIDALHVGMQMNSFSKLVEAAKASLGEDYRLGKENEYGRGAGRLLNAVRVTLQGAQLGNLAVDSHMPEAAICLSYLESISESVVRGIR